jgi:hypothetical protein
VGAYVTALVGCGPPAPFGWGSPYHPLRSLASSVAAAVLSRDLHVSRSPPCALLSLDTRLPAAARTRSTPAPVRAQWPLGPGRLRSVRPSTLRSSEAALAFPVTFARFRLTPFRPAWGDSASSRHEPPRRATSRLLGLPLDSPRSREEDAPSRRLLPTHDTSTRGSPGSRARGFRLATAPPAPSVSPTLRFDAGPPCGNPAPGRGRLTAPPQLRLRRSLRSRRPSLDFEPRAAAVRPPRRRGVVDHVRR